TVEEMRGKSVTRLLLEVRENE
ncbi:MAG: hypothetical protein JG766_1647, partial [Desulfacinum sp.]|nr:hypothetical protein [Desulfacinum sp.]